MQQCDSPALHQCYEEYVFSNFYDGVKLIVQELTTTVGHSKTEKRFTRHPSSSTRSRGLDSSPCLCVSVVQFYFSPFRRPPSESPF